MCPKKSSLNVQAHLIFVVLCCCSLGGDVAVNSGSTATVIERDQKAGAAYFNIVDNLLVPADELASVSGSFNQHCQQPTCTVQPAQQASRRKKLQGSVSLLEL